MNQEDIENIINFVDQKGESKDLNDLRSINVIRQVAKTLFDKFKEEMKKSFNAGYDSKEYVEMPNCGRPFISSEQSQDFEQWFKETYENHNS